MSAVVDAAKQLKGVLALDALGDHEGAGLPGEVAIAISTARAPVSVQRRERCCGRA
jgi:hypothetical protein